MTPDWAFLDGLKARLHGLSHEEKILLINTLVAFLSAVGTLVYVVLTFLMVRTTYRSAKSSERAVENLKEANLSPIAEVEKMLGDIPTALEFHGIREEELAEHGLSASEFAYLVASFTVGGTYHRALEPDSRTPFKEGTYRYNMCLSQKTQDAWPLLKRMLNPTPFRDRIEATFGEIKAKAKANGLTHSDAGNSATRLREDIERG
jgi:hypothetical protein